MSMRIIHVDSDNNVDYGEMLGSERINSSYHGIRCRFDNGEEAICMGIIIPETPENLDLIKSIPKIWDHLVGLNLCFKLIDLIRSGGMNGQETMIEREMSLISRKTNTEKISF